ncbi:MAG TPA: fumarylacetoacetate hydrolase family protein [Phycisphaerales bacterium]|nr:fumarylacetoacetate hydrolase family protein [Phycisphaerales bacterium]
MKLQHLEFGVGVQLSDDGAVLPIRHIIGIGRNYREHAREQGVEAPERPMVFTKNPAAACLAGDQVVIPDLCRDEATGGPHQVDFEAELGVVLGSAVKDVAVEEALACVLGYTCVNDISARWWQKQGSGGQFCRGKSFDTFCPLGPVVVPAAEIPDPQDLRVICRLNGAVMQQDTTGNMMHTVAGLIAELSRGTTLLPGTLIMTGTPGGVGMARTPPVYLKDGDTVEVEIPRIGTLKNRVVNG